MVLVFLCLTSLSMITSRSIHVATHGIIYSFIWSSNIPLYICTISSFFKKELFTLSLVSHE